MHDEKAPPTPLPPAAQAPWPEHPAPHGAARGDVVQLPVRRRDDPPKPPAGVGTLGITLIGGAVAAAIGLVIALPAWRRKAAAKKSPRRRRRNG